jgi:hypothetical protein
MASLKTPRATLRGARKRLTNLKIEIESLRHFKLDSVSVNPHPSRRPNLVRYNLANPLEDISAELGSISADLRAVLDQIVYALCELRTGQPPPPKSRTQFPICKTPNDFQSRIRPDLEGLWFPDVAAIERLQPYNGGNWLRRLKEFADAHKHKTQITIQSRMIQKDHRRDYTLQEIKANPEAFTTLPSVGIALMSGTIYPVPVPKTVQVNANFTEEVTFSDGSPVIYTLEILQAEMPRLLMSSKRPSIEAP